jgi:uncharacterized lipoprotein YmbA
MTMRLPLLVALLALPACADPDYFLLPAPAGTARQAQAGSVAVAELSLPSYAEAIEIATLTAPGQLDLLKNALWADTPRRALTRHLVAALEARVGGPVLTEPWPAFDPPARRVEVMVDRMIGAPGGTLEFGGQFTVVAPESGRLLAAERFAIAVPPQGEGYPGLLAAHARAVEQLADRIAARIAGRPAA